MHSVRGWREEGVRWWGSAWAAMHLLSQMTRFLKILSKDEPGPSALWILTMYTWLKNKCTELYKWLRYCQWEDYEINRTDTPSEALLNVNKDFLKKACYESILQNSSIATGKLKTPHLRLLATCLKNRKLAGTYSGRKAPSGRMALERRRLGFIWAREAGRLIRFGNTR